MKQSHHLSGIPMAVHMRLATAFSLLTALLFLMQPATAQISTAVGVDIGLTQLRAENPSLTEGVGGKAHLVEAYSGADRYVPDPDHPELIGNTINIVGMPATAVLSEITSSHARGSALLLYGSRGVARDLGTGGLSIDVYVAASAAQNSNDNTPTVDWLNFNVYNGGGDPNLPQFDRSTVSSHSYIFTLDPDDIFPMLMRRLDYIVNETDTTTVVGTRNSGSIPPAWTPAYNVIAAGLSRGTHGSGLTTTYGSGRVAIDVVCPVGSSSSATPIVAGAAAILQDAANGSDASTSEVIRATILAGATKDASDIDGTWSRTSTQPLDPVFGAGELNILNSYNIQQGGEFNGGAMVPVALPSLYGWDYEGSLELNGQRLYEFEVTAGNQLEDFSVVLAWNHNIHDNGLSSFIFSPEERLANLSLELLDSSGTIVDSSVSDVDNVEHVFQQTLAAGTYQLRVSNDNGFANDYGLAWRGDLVATLGDCNLDGVVDFQDIDPFIVILINGTYLEQADCNQDGVVDFSDIPAFITILNG